MVGKQLINFSFETKCKGRSMKNSNFLNNLPNKIDIIDEPTLIKVYTRGNMNEPPKDLVTKYIPEGNTYDIPRSFITKVNPRGKYIYRENAFLPIENKQRPIVIKYLIQFDLKDNFPIFLIRYKGELSRKLREIKYQIREIEKQEISLIESIILIYEGINLENVEINIPTHAFICYYNYRS